jgi:hypothetical protein
MSAPAEWAITRTFPINNKLSVTMTAGPGGFTCEWSPTIPRELKKKERNRYRAGRDSLLAEVAHARAAMFWWSRCRPCWVSI